MIWDYLVPCFWVGGIVAVVRAVGAVIDQGKTDRHAMAGCAMIVGSAFIGGAIQVVMLILAFFNLGPFATIVAVIVLAAYNAILFPISIAMAMALSWAIDTLR